MIKFYPSDKDDFNSEIYMWVGEREFANGLDSILFTTVKDWINKDWPFNKVTYPGRSKKQEDWNTPNIIVIPNCNYLLLSPL